MDKSDTNHEWTENHPRTNTIVLSVGFMTIIIHYTDVWFDPLLDHIVNLSSVQDLPSATSTSMSQTMEILGMTRSHVI